MKCNCNCKYRGQEQRSKILGVKLTRHMLHREKDLCMSWLNSQPCPQSDAASDDAADCPAQHHQHPQDWRSAAGVYDASAAVTGNPHRGLFWCALGPIPGAFGMGDAISRALRSVATGADQTEKRWSMKGKACATRLRRTLKHGYSPSPSDTVREPVVDVHRQCETVFLVQHSSKTLAIGQCEVSQPGLTPTNSPRWLEMRWTVERWRVRTGKMPQQGALLRKLKLLLRPNLTLRVRQHWNSFEQ